LKIAAKYEHNLNSNNKPQLLPLIAFHYGQSRDFNKKIESLNNVGEHFVETGSFPEGISFFIFFLFFFFFFFF